MVWHLSFYTTRMPLRKEGGPIYSIQSRSLESSVFRLESISCWASFCYLHRYIIHSQQTRRLFRKKSCLLHPMSSSLYRFKSLPRLPLSPGAGFYTEYLSRNGMRQTRRRAGILLLYFGHSLPFCKGRLVPSKGYFFFIPSYSLPLV